MEIKMAVAVSMNINMLLIKVIKRGEQKEAVVPYQAWTNMIKKLDALRESKKILWNFNENEYKR